MKITFTYLNPRITVSVILAFFTTALCNQSFAQSNLGWNFGVGSASLAPSSGTPATNLTVSNFVIGNAFGSITANTNVAPLSSGYTGASGNYYYGHAARTGAFFAGSSAYYQVTLTPAGGNSVVINSISFGSRSAATGPSTYAIRSSANNYGSNIATGSVSASWALKTNNGLNLSSSNNAAIVIRIYGYGGSGTFTGGSINWEIDDVIINYSLVNTANYRTKTTGNFSSAATWQYNSVGATWLNASTAPTDKNNISVLHNLTLDQNFSVASGKTFTIGTGGSLTINPGKTLDVQSGGTADFGGYTVTVKSTAAGSGAIGKILGTLSNASNVTVERYIPANSSRAWRFLAVPTTGTQTIYEAWQENGAPLVSNGYGTIITKPGANPSTNGFDASSGSASIMNTYNQTTNVWSNTISSTKTTPVETDGGYFLFVRGDRGKGVSSNNSDVNATILRTNGTLKQGSITSATVGAGKYVPLGNPYASAIAFDQLTRTGGVDATFYIWDAKLIQGASLGAYQTFTASNGYVPTPGGGSFSGANTTIESGQAFFVHATGSAGDVTFDESAKLSTTSNLGFRPVTSSNLGKLVKLTTKLFGTDSDIVLDGNDVVFDSKYDNAVNSNDAFKLANPIENIGIANNKQVLAVEARQPAADKDEIVFSLSNLKQQTYKLQITPQNLAAEGLTATLEDSYKKTSTVLSLDEKNELEFTVDANAASSAANRFKVVFKVAKVAAPQIVIAKPAIRVSPNPVEGSNMNVQFAGKAAGNYTMRLLSNAGQVLLNQTVQHAGGNMYNHSVTLPSGIKAGTYQLEVVSPDKTRTVQKVLVVN